MRRQRASSDELRVASFEWRASSGELRVASFEWRASSGELRACVDIKLVADVWTPPH